METKHPRSLIVIILIAALLALSLACGDTTPTTEPKVSTATPSTADTQSPPQDENATPEPEATTEPIAPPAQQMYLGDAVVGKDVAVAAVAVEDPAAPGLLYTAEEGKRLVAVEVVICNLSDDNVSVNPLNATLVDSEGFTYQPDLGAYSGGQIPTVDLSHAGEKVRGWIAFQVPEASQLASIKYSPGLFSSAYVQASLLQPPAGYVPDAQALSSVPAEIAPKLGDVVEQFGYSLSAVSVEDPTTPGILYKPRQGYKLVAVEIVLGNVSAEKLNVNPLYSTLLDSEGYLYAPELGGRSGQLDAGELAAGEKAKGWVAFEIPESATPASLKVNTAILGKDYLYTGLSQ